MPEEKQRKSIRTAELDKMINKLRSLDRVDGTIRVLQEQCDRILVGFGKSSG